MLSTERIASFSRGVEETEKKSKQQGKNLNWRECSYLGWAGAVYSFCLLAVFRWGRGNLRRKNSKKPPPPNWRSLARTGQDRPGQAPQQGWQLERKDEELQKKARSAVILRRHFWGGKLGFRGGISSVGGERTCLVAGRTGPTFESTVSTHTVLHSTSILTYSYVCTNTSTSTSSGHQRPSTALERSW
jgi:hypothetical protein